MGNTAKQQQRIVPQCCASPRALSSPLFLLQSKNYEDDEFVCAHADQHYEAQFSHIKWHNKKQFMVALIPNMKSQRIHVVISDLADAVFEYHDDLHHFIEFSNKKQQQDAHLQWHDMYTYLQKEFASPANMYMSRDTIADTMHLHVRAIAIPIQQVSSTSQMQYANAMVTVALYKQLHVRTTRKIQPKQQKKEESSPKTPDLAQQHSLSLDSSSFAISPITSPGDQVLADLDALSLYDDDVAAAN